MAIWQVQLYIVPSKFNTMTENETTFSIEKAEIIENEFKCFTNILNREDSWGKGTKQFGSLDATCVEIFYFDNDIEISCRLDLRTLTKAELKSIIAFTENIDGEFLYNNEIVKSEYRQIINILKKSNAFKFCENHIKFISEI